MRKLAIVLLSCLALSGCASSWDGELRYKIVSIDRSNAPTEYFELELVGDPPKGLLWQDGLTPKFEVPSRVGGGATVGDEVVCTAKQEEGSPFAHWSKDTKLSGCKKA
ncbi:hypothetical protein SK803_07430 [Lentzea sp. BCCO 10_0856]|uniref:Ig-like domain-containing protein n=1 Tax=Lentzea miocenica TaxID=3095431 RepID=A0ABU4SVW6_9PSEU|nr:hypothetical protein [Lentzea sp. BCCO 10_0856]MDX8030037.1 hypothetical protein [Lentzea sp. BCCO 10_0856]